ncbi:hypothetical protein J6590_032059, partial [Homalodisca vitripennis]
NRKTCGEHVQLRLASMNDRQLTDGNRHHDRPTQRGVMFTRQPIEYNIFTLM